MSKVSAILFDKDGTLFEFRKSWNGWTASFLLEVCNGDRNRAAELGQALGFDLDTREFAPDSPVIAGTLDEVSAAMQPFFPDRTQDSLTRDIRNSVQGATMVPAVPLVPLLEQLHAQGLRLGVMTNDAEAPARAHLHRAGVLDQFVFVAGYDSGFGAKPDPDPLLAFAQHCDLSPAQVAMVGDSSHDLIAARAAGMVPIGVLTGLATDADLRPLAQAILPNIGALPQWLATQKTG